MGGFRPWAPEDRRGSQVPDRPASTAPPALELDDDEDEPAGRRAPGRRRAQTGLALLMTLFFGWAAGLLVVGRRCHPP